MRKIRFWLNGQEQDPIAHEEWVPPAPPMGYDGQPAGSDAEWEALRRDGKLLSREEMMGKVEQAQPKPATTILGGFVAKLHASIAKTKASAEELQAQIAKDTETLRQMRVSIAAMEAGLVTIGTDPALTAEELGLVDEPFAPTIAEALEEGLTDGQE